MTRHQNITAVSAAVEGILAGRTITLSVEPAQAPAAAPAAYVFWQGDPSAARRARELARAHGGALAPVAEAMPAGESPRARALRQGWQAAYGISAPIAYDARANAAVAQSSQVYVVATLVDGRLAAPLAAYLGACDLAGKHVTVEFLAESGQVRPAAWRTLCELLPRGARITAVAQASNAVMTLITGGSSAGDKFGAAAERARAVVADRMARAA